MAGTSPWPTIHAERKALADDLENLTDVKWATPSMCEDWTVRQVLGHMAGTAEMTPAKFFPKLLASGFKFNAMNAKEVAERTKGAPADTLALFKANVSSSKHPPGPVDSWLGETIVHGEDIRRPLKISHTYPTDALTRVADFYRKSNLILGGKKRVAGLRLRASDADWTAGDGPEVTGPILSIVLAICGRTPAYADLSGEGVSTLKSRP